MKDSAPAKANEKNTQVGAWSFTGELTGQEECGGARPAFLPAPPSTSPRQLQPPTPKGQHDIKSTKTAKKPMLGEKELATPPLFLAF